MGDRANVYVRDAAEPHLGVYLYTHYSGYKLADIVQTALRRELRWNDDQYLARIIFDAMTEGRHGKETGAGISATLRDNSYPIIEIDCQAARVRLYPQPPYGRPTPWREAAPTHEWHFGEFCALDEPTLRIAWSGEDEAE